MQSTDIIAEARRVLDTPRGGFPGCTWQATVAEWRDAAERALDGDTDDLSFYLDIDAAEVWNMSEARQDEWFEARLAAASESTVLVGLAA